MRRDTGLVIALVAQSVVSSVAGSAALATLATPHVIAAITILNGMLASGTAAYVAATRERHEDALEEVRISR